MKLKDTGNDEFSFDFETPEPGESILMIDDGVRKYYNENSGKTSLIVPFTIDRVISGPESNVGLKITLFVSLEKTYGEKQLENLLTIVGIIDWFFKKYGEEVDINDDRFINELSLKLPGKFIRAEHAKRIDKNKKERAYITKLAKAYTNIIKPIPGNENGAQNSSNWD